VLHFAVRGETLQLHDAGFCVCTLLHLHGNSINSCFPLNLQRTLTWNRITNLFVTFREHRVFTDNVIRPARTLETGVSVASVQCPWSYCLFTTVKCYTFTLLLRYITYLNYYQRRQ